MSDLVRTLETRYIYSQEQAAEKVKSAKGYVHVSMESQLTADGSKRWRVVGYRKPKIMERVKSKLFRGRRPK